MERILLDDINNKEYESEEAKQAAVNLMINIEIRGLIAGAPRDVPETEWDNKFLIAAENFCTAHCIDEDEQEEFKSQFRSYYAYEYLTFWQYSAYDKEEWMNVAISKIGVYVPNRIIPLTLQAGFVEKCTDNSTNLSFENLKQYAAMSRHQRQLKLKEEAKKNKQQGIKNIIVYKEGKAEALKVKNEDVAKVWNRYIDHCNSQKQRVEDARTLWRAAVAQKKKLIDEQNTIIEQLKEACKALESETINWEDFKANELPIVAIS